MNSKKKKGQKNFTIIEFCLSIFAFMVVTILRPSSQFSEKENRVLAEMPEIKIDDILNGDFEKNYEKYLSDQFILRDQWISLKTHIERLILKRESKDIYFAKEGYLIEKHTGTFSTQIAKRNIISLMNFVKKYDEQFGRSHISVLIVPNAIDILQDKLPPFASSGDGEDYIEQIGKSLPEKVWIDIVSILREHSSEEIYYRTDHHWKTLAAFYAYQAWARKYGYVIPKLADYEIKKITDHFEGTIQSKLGIDTIKDSIELFYPINRSTYTIYDKSTNRTNKSLYDHTVLDKKNKYSIYFGGNAPFLQIKTEIENERKILVIKDSYANCFIPFMLGEFQEIDVLDLRYTNQRLSEIISKGRYTDILILYNVAGFAEDISISKLLN